MEKNKAVSRLKRLFCKEKYSDIWERYKNKTDDELNEIAGKEKTSQLEREVAKDILKVRYQMDCIL